MTNHEFGEEIGKEIARSIAQKIAMGIALLFGFAFLIIFGGFVVQWLWNWLVPGLFGLRQLTIWEALGLLALSRILFGAMGSRRRRGRISDLGEASGGRRRGITAGAETTPPETEQPAT